MATNVKIETCNNGRIAIVYSISFLKNEELVNAGKVFTTRRKALIYAEERGWNNNPEFDVYPIELVY